MLVSSQIKGDRMWVGNLKSMNFSVQLSLVLRHSISQPESIPEGALDTRLVRLKHPHRLHWI